MNPEPSFKAIQSAEAAIAGSEPPDMIRKAQAPDAGANAFQTFAAPAA